MTRNWGLSGLVIVSVFVDDPLKGAYIMHYLEPDPLGFTKQVHSSPSTAWHQPASLHSGETDDCVGRVEGNSGAVLTKRVSRSDTSSAPQLMQSHSKCCRYPACCVEDEMVRQVGAVVGSSSVRSYAVNRSRTTGT